MPFLRPITVRTVTLAVAIVAMVATTGSTPARAEPHPGSVRPVTGADTASVASCPEPLRASWHERGPRGCFELYLVGATERDDEGDEQRPVTPAELALLNLGDLPAYATVDVDAIAASLAAYEQHLADEAAARAAAERTARDAAAAAAAQARKDAGQPTRTAGPRDPMRFMPTLAQLERMMADCGLGFDYAGAVGEHPCIAAAWAAIVATMPTVDVPSGAADWHSAMLAGVNALRADAGVRQVSSCPALTRISQDYAVVLKDWGRIDHTGPDGSSPLERAIRGGYVSSFGSENLALTPRADVGRVLEGWLESAYHRENILDPRWRQAGFGLARSATGQVFWVQMFGTDGDC
jgi:uncharacterized protein YkwD